jgi:hypothetical protein
MLAVRLSEETELRLSDLAATDGAYKNLLRGRDDQGASG